MHIHKWSLSGFESSSRRWVFKPLCWTVYTIYTWRDVCPRDLSTPRQRLVRILDEVSSRSRQRHQPESEIQGRREFRGYGGPSKLGTETELRRGCSNCSSLSLSLFLSMSIPLSLSPSLSLSLSLPGVQRFTCLLLERVTRPCWVPRRAEREQEEWTEKIRNLKLSEWTDRAPRDP